MSEYSSPVSAAFELQRSALESTHEAIGNSVQAQKQLNDAMIDGFTPARNASQRSADLVRTGFDTYFDTVESVAPAGSGLNDVREMVNEQLDLLEESQLDVIDQFETGLHENADSTEELLDEFLEALDEQVSTLLNAHEDLEGQTIKALERLEDGLDELLSEIEARGEEMQEQFEAQADAIQEQLEDVTENVQEATETADLTA